MGREKAERLSYQRGRVDSKGFAIVLVPDLYEKYRQHPSTPTSRLVPGDEFEDQYDWEE